MNIWFSLMIIAIAVLTFCIVLLLLRRRGEDADNRERRMQLASQQTKQEEVFEELNLSFYQRIIEPKVSKFVVSLSNLAPGLFGNEKSNKEIERQLHLAGEDQTVAEYSVGKTLKTILIIFIVVVLALVFKLKGSLLLLILCGGILAALLLPRMQLNSKVKKRQGEIQKQLPDVIDLLSVCMTAGLSFDASVQRVTEKMEGPFIDELKNMHRDLQMGRPRRDALKNLGESCDVEELRIFTSAVIQADSMGIPIKNILTAQSSQLRLMRKQLAKEKGNKAPVKMLIPMILFIFPVIFIVLLGPAVFSLSGTLL